tara:strand:- start:386 stop:1561 length:1176 start_codon:yes stop_codon:yes gene_type:complete
MKDGEHSLKTLDVKNIFGSEAFYLMDLINKSDFECYIVGGALRNYFLGKSLLDIDLATSAEPSEIIKILKEEALEFDERASKYGTLFVKIKKKRFELTSFRKDIETFGRSAKVLFSRDINYDAQRRDFTFNAIYCSKEGNIVDPLNSLQDLQKKRLRFIGDAEKRIKEDFLRILRFFRFIAELDLKPVNIDQRNLEVISTLKDNLDMISKERISGELKRIFLSKNPTISLEFLAKTKVYKKLLGYFYKKRIKKLIELETQLELAPALERRFLSLNIKETVFIMSKEEKKYFEALKASLKDVSNPKYLGFNIGYKRGLDCLVIKAVRNNRIISKKEQKLLEEGSKKIFPLTYSDIEKKLQDKFIANKKLEYLKNIWVKSDFRISSEKLKNYL